MITIRRASRLTVCWARDKVAYELGLEAGFKLATDGSIAIRFYPRGANYTRRQDHARADSCDHART